MPWFTDPLDAGDRDEMLRPFIVLALAVAQAVITAVAAARIGVAADDGPPSPVGPATYAFGIWFPIFALSIAFGVWQALPGNRGRPAARAVGWPMAGAFATICGWSIVVPLRLEWLSQILLLACSGLLATAFLRLVSNNQVRPLTTGERWFVALPIAPFLGWVTAANAVSLHAQAVRYGLLPPVGAASIGVGVVLLAIAVAAGCCLLRAGRESPPQLRVVFGGTLIWALVAVAIEQREQTPIVALVAVAGIVAVAVALLFPPADGARRSPGFPIPA